MSSNFQMRSEEVVLFRGDITIIKSKMSVLESDGVITNQRCVLGSGADSFVAERSELVKVTEGKHGFATKFELTHANGQSMSVLAANTQGFQKALNALTGKISMAEAQQQPDISTVKNTWAWVAALGPVIAGMIVLFLAGLMGWNLDNASGLSLLKLVLFRWFLIYFFLRIDHLMLQKQGFDTVAIGITAPEKFWLYLSSRAKAFGHGQAYVITWWVLVALDVLSVLS